MQPALGVRFSQNAVNLVDLEDKTTRCISNRAYSKDNVRLGRSRDSWVRTWLPAAHATRVLFGNDFCVSVLETRSTYQAHR